MTSETPHIAESGSLAPSQDWLPIEKMMRERLRKCVTLLPQVLSEDDPNAVHDLRVWTRRLQQVIVTLFPDPSLPEARMMTRALRRARQALGGWRDCDVVVAALVHKVRQTRNAEQKQAWEFVLASARDEGRRQARLARKALANRKLFTLAHHAQILFEHRANHANSNGASPMVVLQASIRAAYEQWREGLARAKASMDPIEVHAFRINTKRLRYRIELLRDLGSPKAKAALSSLKDLQEELGSWHDNLSFARIVSEALANPEFLMQHPRAASVILRRFDREGALHLAQVKRLLNEIPGSGGLFRLHRAIAACCGEPPTFPRNAGIVQPNSNGHIVQADPQT